MASRSVRLRWRGVGCCGGHGPHRRRHPLLLRVDGGRAPLPQAARRGGRARPADYTKDDTVASLTMGVASLLVPLATGALVRRMVPGRTRAGNALVGVAVGAAAVTTVADRLAGHDADEPADPRDRVVEDHDVPHGRGRELRRLARKVRRITGPVAMGAGMVAASAWVADRTKRQADVGEGPAPRPRRGSRCRRSLAIVGWDFIYYWNHRLHARGARRCGRTTSCTTRASATTSPPRCGSPSPTCSACTCPTG